MTAREKTFCEELDKLIEEGENLYQAIQEECKAVDTIFQETFFRQHYQQWYSKADIIIKTILPNRHDEFVSCYKYQEDRETLKKDNFRIQDYLHNKFVVLATGSLFTNNYKSWKDCSETITFFYQQLSILKAVKEMLSSKLLDLKALVQADLFDSEIEVARELAKKGFLRAAGAICGVIIEKHLHALCERHNITISKKNPGINDLCVILRSNDVIDVPQERFIMSCADVRNLCDHNRGIEPTQTQINHLLSDTKRIIDTIY
ncbi:hypothetical protein [Commensalibacter oyaizuii]|uniref:DUF4145 domain-containing protein n=1 Tax=Commensalibacter oyaizuii TaxID=3043873 RepID=A0ABT6Q314_9PROT|nr:hypothetical protein [Commensalibacter sp. TBRC 16381]MDI2091519.1 hypothetical protein [Commensalibacter sp. TBRC 16381]